jgi:hypothetical protein
MSFNLDELFQKELIKKFEEKKSNKDLKRKDFHSNILNIITSVLKELQVTYCIDDYLIHVETNKFIISFLYVKKISLFTLTFDKELKFDKAVAFLCNCKSNLTSVF